MVEVNQTTPIILKVNGLKNPVKMQGFFELGIKLKMLFSGDSLQIQISEWIKVISRKPGVPL